MATAVPSTDQAAPSPEPIPCAHAPSKPPAHVYDKIITIAVGPDDAKNKYKVYRGLLCHFSSYFDRMLNGSFREGGSTYLRLEEINPGTFNVFYYWLNSGIVDCTNGNKSLTPADVWDKMINAYIFADFHQSQIFRNAVLGSLFLYYGAQRGFHIAVVPRLYVNTHEGDAMGNLLVDLMVGSSTLEGFPKTHLDFLNNDFLLDYIVICTEKKLVPGSSSWEAGVHNVHKNFCERYQQHDERVRP